MNVKQVSEESGGPICAGGELAEVWRPGSGHRPVGRRSHEGITFGQKRYDRDLEDIFALQDEITIKILYGPPSSVDRGGGLSRVDKYADKYYGGKHGLDCYLKLTEACRYFQRHNIDGMSLARQIAEEVLAMCPENPAAYLRLGWVHRFEYMLGNTGDPLGSRLRKAWKQHKKPLL